MLPSVSILANVLKIRLVREPEKGLGGEITSSTVEPNWKQTIKP